MISHPQTVIAQLLAKKSDVLSNLIIVLKETQAAACVLIAEAQSFGFAVVMITRFPPLLLRPDREGIVGMQVRSWLHEEIHST